jgi:hypothetical protein
LAAHRNRKRILSSRTGFFLNSGGRFPVIRKNRTQ